MTTASVKPYCRSCRVFLYHFSMDGMDVHMCPKCDSKLIYLSELDKKIRKRTIAQFHELAAASTKRSSIDCGHCGKDMRIVQLPESRVQLDICRACNALWFGGKGEEYETFLLEEISLKPSAAVMLQDHRVGDLEKDAAFVSYNYDLIYRPQVMSHIHDRPEELSHASRFAGPIFLLMILITFVALRREDLFRMLAHSTSQPLPRQLFTTFTAFFVHGSWSHLFGNAVFFYFTATNVEQRIGSSKFLELIAVSLIADSVFSYFFFGQSQVYSIGASVGIMALLSYYVMADPFRPMRIVFTPPFRRHLLEYRTLSVSAWIVFVLFILKEVSGLNRQLRGDTNISHTGHLVGILVGILFFYIFPPPKKTAEVPPPTGN